MSGPKLLLLAALSSLPLLFIPNANAIDDVDSPNDVPPVEVTDNMFKTPNTPWNCVNGTMNAGVFCRTDGAAVSVFLESSLSSSARTKIQSTLTNNYGATQLTIAYASSLAPNTDIVYQQGQVPIITGGTVLGVTWCRVAATTEKCDQHFVRFNYESIAPSTQFVACHETGHAVGLTHGQNAYPKFANSDARLECLRTPYVGSYYAKLGPMNIANINAVY